MSARIRPATAEDGPRLQAIERRAGERFRTIGMDAVADDEPLPLDVLASEAAAGRCWVAAGVDDAPIGYVLVAEVDGTAHVEQVTVDPDHQGRGVGTALLDQVRTWGTAHGLPATTLTTFTDVPWNGPLYAHLGFRTIPEAELGPQLAAIRRAEAARGLDALGGRAAMVRHHA